MEVITEDFDYVVHDGTPLRARLYRPRGRGPFPAVVDAHGGAWIQGSYVNNDPINRPIAQAGVVVLAIDYRLPPVGTYPASVADVNYAVRWLKHNAERYSTPAQAVGVMGTSSGGHLAVLAALKPDDPRYCAVQLANGTSVDASAAYVVSMWPVICPLTRYRENLERNSRGVDDHGGRVGGGLDQMRYWIDEAAMADGSPVMALERGDAVATPDMLYVQALCDTLHPRHSMDRFCELYRRAGGTVETVLVEGEPYDLVRSKADSSEAKRAVTRIIEFIHERSGLASNRTGSQSTGSDSQETK